MSRRETAISRKWKSTDLAKNNDTSDNAVSSSDSSIERSPYIRNSSTPLRNRWPSAETIKRLPDRVEGRSKFNDTESKSTESGDSVGHQKTPKTKKSRDTRSESHDNFGKAEKRRERHAGQRGRKKRERFQASENEKRQELESDSPSSGRPHNEAHKSKRKNKFSEGEDEVPITEILKRSQENSRTKYEKPQPFPELTADKIYIQRGKSFSAVKLDRSRSHGEKETGRKKSLGFPETQSYPAIRVAIVAQKLWKCTGLLSQGILGGMGLMHFILLILFFNSSVEFVSQYSVMSEIYTNIFSCLITLCIVATFDKFDLARFDMDHLREIYADYGKTAFAIPLYLIVFCLHQVSLKTDEQLALSRYYALNETLWDNTTNIEDLLEELNSWQRITLSKDLLAVFSWLFISFGTADDSFLIHLESMTKYSTNDLPE